MRFGVQGFDKKRQSKHLHFFSYGLIVQLHFAPS